MLGHGASSAARIHSRVYAFGWAEGIDNTGAPPDNFTVRLRLFVQRLQPLLRRSATIPALHSIEQPLLYRGAFLFAH